MPKIGWSEDTFDLVEVREAFPGRAKKVGVHRREAAGRVYESPKIILNRRYKNFIGRHFRAYIGRAIYRVEGSGLIPAFQQEGDCIILFFPDSWKEK